MPPSSPPLQVAIADDHALFRQGLRTLLEHRGITVVGETERADDIVPLLESRPCDLLLLDLQMDRDVLVDIEALAARVRVVVVTASQRPEEALAAVRAGASGVVFKRFALETLLDAVQAVAAGQAWMPPALQACMANELREPNRDPLTPREREIVQQVALGLRNAQVAKTLFISEETVKSHLANIFQKLDVHDRHQLTFYALRRGLVGVHEPQD